MRGYLFDFFIFFIRVWKILSKSLSHLFYLTTIYNKFKPGNPDKVPVKPKG